MLQALYDRNVPLAEALIRFFTHAASVLSIQTQVCLVSTAICLLQTLDAGDRHHSAAVTLCGKLFTWGHGKSGRLGHGSEEVCMLPTLVEALANQKVVDVAAAETHTAAVTSEGELYTWGRDRFGQLGHGSAGSSGKLAPKRVEGLRKATVTGVAAGSEHTAVVTRSGNVSAFPPVFHKYSAYVDSIGRKQLDIFREKAKICAVAIMLPRL